MEKTNRIKVFGLLALPIVALVVALMVFSIGHSTSNDVEASGPSQSLGATGAVDCGGGPFVPVDKPVKCGALFIPGAPKLAEFTITVSGNDLDAIAGFGAEVLPGGLTYNPRALCGDSVQLTPLVICTSAVGGGGEIRFGASTGATPPFGAANGTPGSIVLLELDMHCAAAGTFKVIATNNPPSSFGAVFFDAPAGDPVAVTKEGGTTGQADTLEIQCIIPPTSTQTPTPTDTPTATPTPTQPPVPRWFKEDIYPVNNNGSQCEQISPPIPANCTSPQDPGNDDLSNLWLTRQGSKIPPLRCEDSTDQAIFREALSFDPIVPDPKGVHSRAFIGAFEFEVRFDNKLVCINLSAGEAAAALGMICFVDDKDTSQLEGIARMGCVTKGKAKSPMTQEKNGVVELAILEVRPMPELYSQIRANQDNGIVIQLLDQDCELADEQGHPLAIFSCEDAQVTARFLEGDVEPDCFVDALDQQSIAFRWGAQKGSVLYNERFDLEPSGAVKGDGDIDIKDLQFVFGRHGSSCGRQIQAGGTVGKPVATEPGSPHPRQAPVNAFQ